MYKHKHETAKQKIINSRAEFPLKMYHAVSRNKCLKVCQCPEISQNHLKTCQIDIKNLIHQKRPKIPNFIWPLKK